MLRWAQMFHKTTCIFICAIIVFSSSLWALELVGNVGGKQSNQAINNAISFQSAVIPSPCAIEDNIQNIEPPIEVDYEPPNIPMVPQDPYPIYGYTTYYDGSGGNLLYNPAQEAYGRLDPGSTVHITWRNSSALAPVPYTTFTVTSDPVTAQFCVDLLYYFEGDPVWVNATSAGWGNNGYNFTSVNTTSSPGGRRQDVICGVPSRLVATNYPMVVNVSEPFTFDYEFQDIDGMLARGYFTPNPPGPVPDGNMDFFSGDPLFVNDAAHPLQFDGLASPTPGTCSSVLALGTVGTHWVNISEGGQFESNPFLTPWGAFYLQNGAPGFENDWANVTINVRTSPVLSVVKEGPASAIAGATIPYRIRVENIGTVMAENITVVEQYSLWTGFVNATPAPDIGNGTWTGNFSGGSIPDLAPSEFFYIYINVSINNTAPMRTVIINNVTVNFTDSMGFYLPEITANVTTLVVSPLISLTKTAPVTVYSGINFGYSISYQNIGTSMAYNVWVNETYPSDIFFIGSNPVPTVPNFAWYIGNLTPGSGGTIDINVLTDFFLANGTILDNFVTCNYTAFSSAMDGWRSVSDNAVTLVLTYTGIPNSNDTGNIWLNATGITIGDYDLIDPSVNQSMLNRQLDVGHEYYFYVNLYAVPDVSNIDLVTIRAWYDMGDDMTQYGVGAPNTEFALQYNRFSSNFSLASTYTSGDPEVRDIWGARNQTGANQLQLYFYFTLGEQIRHAPGDGPMWDNATGIWDTNIAFNDLFSWNFNIKVLANNSMTANAFDEFGVYAFTRLSVGDLFAWGMPGQVVAFPQMMINYSSNDVYRLGVCMNSTLTKIWPTTTPFAIIGEGNVSTSAGMLGKTDFSGIGLNYSLYYYPIRDAPAWGTYRNLWVQFWVFVPINALGGIYRGELIYILEQI